MVVPEGVCVHCGFAAGSLYRQYSPAVLRLTQCTKCGNIADKYLEYDPVIIVVDLILLSKEAFRHVLHNTTFKAYGKLFLLLLILETYADWSNYNMYKIVNKNIIKIESNRDILDENSYLHIFQSNYTPLSSMENVSDDYTASKSEDERISIEIDVYLIFVCELCGMAVFFINGFIFSLFFKLNSLLRHKVEFLLFCKAMILGSSGNFFLLSCLIWGNDHDRFIHLILVFGYTFLALINIHSVIFQCGKMNSLAVLFISFIVKTSITSYLKTVMRMLLV